MFDEQNSQKLPVRKAVFWILISTFLISGSTTGALIYFWSLRKSNELDPKYNIIAVVQIGPDKDVLKTEYLAELLQLSTDQPTNLFKLSLEDAKDRLLKSALIKSVDVRRVKPGTLYIDYRVRKPIAFFAEYSNTAIDEEGVLIPFAPFFTPKKLPELICGFDSVCDWGGKIKGEQIEWALHFFKNDSNVRRIDLSQSRAESLGKREIVVIYEGIINPETRILRLSPENMDQQLSNYKMLEKHFVQNPIESSTIIVDLRVEELAFLTPIK